MRYQINQTVDAMTLTDVKGNAVAIPDPEGRFTHLQFRRWEGCPICNTHIAAFRKHAPAIAAAGVREVILFHSKPEDVARFQKDLPFTLVGDPGKKWYRAFGVRASLAFILNWRVLLAFAQGLLAGRINLNMRNGPHGLPADFLIAPDGRIVALNYGKHAYDQWSAQDLLAIVQREQSSLAVHPGGSGLTMQASNPAMRAA